MDKVPKVYITRRTQFAACHRLHSPKLTPQENVEVYGKCNHINGHGHNYVVEVTLYGPIDSTSGMVMNLTELKEYMIEAIMKPMDHKNLDADVEYFREHPSTAENVAIYIWTHLEKLMKNPTLLYEVKVVETENNSAVYRGETS